MKNYIPSPSSSTGCHLCQKVWLWGKICSLLMGFREGAGPTSTGKPAQFFFFFFFIIVSFHIGEDNIFGGG